LNQAVGMGDGSMCPRYQRAAMLLGKKWTGLLLRVLLAGPTRFCGFGEQVPRLSDRVLSERLKEMEDEGLVERVVHTAKPVRVEYRLTPKGRALAPVVEAIQAWADRWIELPPCCPEASAEDDGGGQ
jgi:DNA-binding HxlR family transcriptional regulator